jgi:hypothetical protein
MRRTVGCTTLTLALSCCPLIWYADVATAQAACVNTYETQGGNNKCSTLVAAGLKCSTDFCHAKSCQYKGLCDKMCHLCAASTRPAPTPAPPVACVNTYETQGGNNKCSALVAAGLKCSTDFCRAKSCQYRGLCDKMCHLCAASTRPAPAPPAAPRNQPTPPPHPQQPLSPVNISAINPSGYHGCPDRYGSQGCRQLLVAGVYACRSHFCATCASPHFCDGTCGFCSAPVPEPEPEPEPAPKAGCRGHQVLDCKGHCSDRKFIGDGFCDDSARYHFACKQYKYDGGDCLSPKPPVKDCVGQSAPAQFIGDGICDKGTTAHNGRWINLNCLKHKFDGGDCKGDLGKISKFQCVQLVKGLDACDHSSKKRVDGCNRPGCTSAILAMRASWDECTQHLGLDDELIKQFELVCGKCSPLPVLDTCGIFHRFPRSRDPCSSTCASGLIIWYESQFSKCGRHMEDLGATRKHTAQLTDFYRRCKTSPILVVRAQDKCPTTDLGIHVHKQPISIMDKKGKCHLSPQLLEETCGRHLVSCVQALERAAQRSMPPACKTSPCGCVFLGPDVGWSNSVWRPDSSVTRRCRESVPRLAQVCGKRFLQCLLIIDTLHERSSAAPVAQQTNLWSAEGTLTLASRDSVVVPSSRNRAIFVAMARNDIATALNISIDYVCVTQVALTPIAQSPKSAKLLNGDRWVTLHYQVTSNVSEVRALRMLFAIEGMAKTPRSALRKGDVTDTVIQAGEIKHELALHPCPPMFLGPDVGYASVSKTKLSSASKCVIDMRKMQSVCQDFYLQCLNYVRSPTKICNGHNDTIPNSDRNAQNPCKGAIGDTCTFRCTSAFIGIGRHKCLATGSWSGGTCRRPAAVPCDTTPIDHAATGCRQTAVDSTSVWCSGVVCLPGFQLSGRFMCHHDGTVSGGECKKVPTPPTHAVQTPLHGTRPTQAANHAVKTTPGRVDGSASNHTAAGDAEQPEGAKALHVVVILGIAAGCVALVIALQLRSCGRRQQVGFDERCEPVFVRCCAASYSPRAAGLKELTPPSPPPLLAMPSAAPKIGRQILPSIRWGEE